MFIFRLCLCSESGGERFIFRCNLSLKRIDRIIPCVIHAVFLCLCLLNFNVLVDVCLCMSEEIVLCSVWQFSVGSVCGSVFSLLYMSMF
jgi:hypothetical protein